MEKTKKKSKLIERIPYHYFIGISSLRRGRSEDIISYVCLCVLKMVLEGRKSEMESQRNIKRKSERKSDREGERKGLRKDHRKRGRERRERKEGREERGKRKRESTKTVSYII